MVALMVPIVLVLLTAGTLMIMAHRQNSADERHEKEALEQTARHAKSYEDGLRDERLDSYPSQEWTRATAQRHSGTLISYAQSDQSLTTLVKFFATYRDISFFGGSTSRIYRLYLFHFQEGAEGGPRRITPPLQQCSPT
jgi:hypothetical protein